MEKIKKYIIILLFIIVIAGLTALFAYINVLVLPNIQFAKYQSGLNIATSIDSTFNAEAELKTLNKKLDQLNKKMQRLTPGNAFLVINTTNNTFELYKNNEIIREGKCSTGSFISLEVDSTKSYLFETPKGVMTVQNKITNPVWTKPDWAFIEEGLPVPPQGHSSRREANVLGDYALKLGDGYMIHGTLYQRLIGSPVTHGCVRLLDDDLEAVYKTLPVGAKVFIY
ncbi:MAG TPA: L,D-transpeptidase [Draconibacterium sp.]|nr:L,D-transpeptidase [Draconibacterium sp.]HRX10633.1 L,D-transpeptidase [Draconibacterium sp.]